MYKTWTYCILQRTLRQYSLDTPPVLIVQLSTKLSVINSTCEGRLSRLSRLPRDKSKLFSTNSWDLIKLCSEPRACNSVRRAEICYFFSKVLETGIGVDLIRIKSIDVCLSTWYLCSSVTDRWHWLAFFAITSHKDFKSKSSICMQRLVSRFSIGTWVIWEH